MPDSSDGGVLFGDSSTFPYGLDFLEITRGALACAVTLLSAQQAIELAQETAGESVATGRKDEGRLDQMLQALGSTISDFRASRSPLVVDAAEAAAAAMQEIVERKRALVQERTRQQLEGVHVARSHGLSLAWQALERFLLAHEMPESGLELAVRSEAGGYTAMLRVATPFGVDADFRLAVPERGGWAGFRRAGNLAANVEVRVHEMGGIFSSKLRARRVLLDGLFVSSLDVGGGRTRLSLRKAPRSGGGFQLEVRGQPERQVFVTHLDEQGELLGETEELRGEHADAVLRLTEATVDASCELALQRVQMTAASFDGRPLGQLDEPKAVAQRLVATLAPVVREIGTRSGAPGELVLRQTKADGFRHEVFVTRGELQQIVLTAPQHLQSVFEPLELEPRQKAPAQLRALPGIR